MSSYALAFLRQGLRLLWAGGDWQKLGGKREAQKSVNHGLIEAFVREAHTREVPLTFVLFYSQHELRETSWREVFLRAELERVGAAYVDTKPILLRAARERAVDVGALYLPDGHLNEPGNAAAAAGIAQTLASAH